MQTLCHSARSRGSGTLADTVGGQDGGGVHNGAVRDQAAVSIRRASADDAETVAALYTRARRDAGDLIPPAVHTEAEDRWWVREVLVPTTEVWLAIVTFGDASDESAGDAVGFLALTGGWLDQLYILRAHTGRGIGSRLVELAKMQQPGGLQLWTFASNVIAQAFYEKHGFSVAERTDGAGNEELAPDIRYVWTGDANSSSTAAS